MTSRPKKILSSISFLVFLVILIHLPAYPQADSMYYMCFQDSTRFGKSGGSNCWGWTSPTGVDYAIMGVFNGVAFVNTQTMETEGFVPGPTGGICGSNIVWREIKTMSHYCYVVSECTGTNQGIMVIDMHYLPDSVHLTGTFPVNNSGAVTSHTLSVDSVGGFLYVEGNTTPATSIYMHNLSNPTSPAFWGSFGISNGIHDMYAYDDTVYVAEGSSGRWAIWDLNNKMDPKLIVRPAIPNAGYVHNVWPTADRHYAATTEETANKTVKIWDISELKNISIVGEYLGPSGMAHNALFKDDTLYLAHYQSGIAVVDITDPTGPVEISRFDTFPLGEGLTFAGAWGCYPFASNGLIFGSNIDGSLWVLKEQYVALGDTLYPGPPVYVGNNHVKVDIYGVNSLPLKKILLPFSYAGNSVMTFDSCSVSGARTVGFTDSYLFNFDFLNQRAAWLLETIGVPLPAGSGVILSIWFTVPNGSSGGFNPIAFLDNWILLEPTFGAECREFRPVDLDYIDICCINNRGNVDGDSSDSCNILDLNFTVNRIFRGGPFPICPEEADLNNDSISCGVLDLNYIVNLVFRSGPQPTSCN